MYTQSLVAVYSRTPFTTKTHEHCKALLWHKHTWYVRACVCMHIHRESGRASERERERERDLEIKGNRDDLMTDRAVARCCCYTDWRALPSPHVSRFCFLSSFLFSSVFFSSIFMSDKELAFSSNSRTDPRIGRVIFVRQIERCYFPSVSIRNNESLFSLLRSHFEVRIYKLLLLLLRALALLLYTCV